jgi:hypothetical protein
MSFKKIMLFLIVGLSMQSCSPRVKGALSAEKFPTLDKSVEVFIMDSEEELPSGSEYVGDLKIGDTSFSGNCEYSQVIEEAKRFSRISGSNLVVLTKVKRPGIASTCYRIKAKMYRNIDSQIVARLSNEIKLNNQSRLPENADYAVVYFYRPKNLAGSALGYKIRHNEDEVIGKVRNGEMFEFRTQVFGNHTFWAKTEKTSSLELDIEPGKEYFVRCNLKLGAFVGRPNIVEVENHIGKKEMASLYN